ncbi:MAG TPA: glutamate-1-semialdehyde 2,1-aminomutase [Planctomycetota bacterium]|nr:glutamate-1-semialdehyde 2,1-aminomutase [Planctomycetota bacterium]
MERSEHLFERARAVIPGGVNSPVRAFKAVGGTPVFLASGRGSRVKDADGREYIDCVGSWGPLILGHAHPEVIEAVTAATARGTTFGAPTEAEVVLAEMIQRRMPSVEKVRLTSSGTEAAMSAVRLARAATGRERILKFEGCYHGHGDSFLVKSGSGALTLGVPSSPGVPAALAALTHAVRFNDLDAVSSALEGRPGEFAAIIVEPVVGNMGTVPPKQGFLEGLRDLSSLHGALLIFDEVITGFRVASGGAEERYGVRPDLSVLGKVVGGGLPLAAYGGRGDVMEKIAPAGPVYQAGTLSGNPLATAAGIATLNVLARPGVYEELERKGARLEAGISRAISHSSIALSFQRVGSMATLFFARGPVESLDSLEGVRTDRYAKLFHGLLEEGVYFPPAQYEAFFISLAHTDEDLDRVTGAITRSLAALER